MQHFRIGLIVALTVLAACGSGSQQQQNGKDSLVAVQPATPAGSIGVAVSGREKDTGKVTITFQLKDQKKEKTFEQSLLKDVPESDLYKVLWNAPNSCYIGIMKANHQPRYYHASVNEKNDLQILWASTPPAPIWQYMENTMGLGRVSAAGNIVGKYKKNIQSGKIIADFIAEIRPLTSADSLELYVEFGGLRKSMFMALPKDTRATIQPTGKDDHVYFSFIKDNKAEPMIDLEVENGRLQIKTLKQIQ
jgi:hypothetical protein